MREKTEEKRLAILRILREAEGPLGSSKITERLSAMGHDISERTVRFHLLDMDKAGLTQNLGRNGRAITPRGSSELDTSRGFEKVGHPVGQDRSDDLQDGLRSGQQDGDRGAQREPHRPEPARAVDTAHEPGVRRRLRHGQADGPAAARASRWGRWPYPRAAWGSAPSARSP